MMPGGPAEGTIRVLHVDDDPSFARLTACSLAEIDGGIEVRSETDPTAVLDRLSDGTPECVVSDYRMPDVDGLELLERVRERHPDLPFILFTGQGTEAIENEAIAADVTDCVSKGGGIAQFERLAARIRRAVERPCVERG
jgi:DNA-binding NtrC family response regulator